MPLKYWLFYVPFLVSGLVGYYAVKRFGWVNHWLHPTAAWLLAISMFLIVAADFLFSRPDAAIVAILITIGFVSLATYVSQQYHEIEEMRENNHETA